MRIIGDIRAQEWRRPLLAFATIAAILVAHQLLETARDALFLARLPATQLPWMYLLIAGLGLGITLLRHRREPGRLRLPILLLLSAVGTAGAWLLVRWPRPQTAYVLYVWTALFITLSVTHYWLAASRLYTASEAKRVFSFLSLGAIVGAIVGSAVAWLLVQILPVSALVLAAAGAQLIAAGLSVPLAREEERVVGESQAEPLRKSLEYVREHPYVSRVGLLVVLSVALFTCLDYFFKNVVAETVAPEDLGSLFATLNIAVNIGSLLVQLFLVHWLLVRVGVTRALSLLPALVLGGSVLVVLGGGLAAALVTKAFDGSLRHSVHRTAVELLYVPMPDAMKRATKVIIDIVGHRGSQALTSVVILAAVRWMDPSIAHFAAATAALALLWLIWARRLLAHYIDLFRSTLLAQSVETHLPLPDLDLRSLESLIRGLNSQDDREVLAAMELLQAQGRAELIPDLILYHPSGDVVLRALDLFEATGRTSCMPIVEHLWMSGDSRLRASALRIHARWSGKRALLREAIQSSDAAIRAVALASLASEADPIGEDVTRGLEAMATGSNEEQRQLAEAIEPLSSLRFARWLEILATSEDRRARIAAAKAMARAPDPRYFDTLLRMLPEKDVRPLARRAIVGLGEDALVRLDEALDDSSLPRPVRQHIPRTLSRFDPEQVAPRVLARLATERDGLVRYKLLRSLGALSSRSSKLALDRALLDEVLASAIGGAFRALHWKILVERQLAQAPQKATPTAELLRSVLEDRVRNALERVTRCLGLLHPTEDLQEIYRAMRGRDRYAQSSGRELLSSLLRSPVREAVLALVDDAPAEERLAAGKPFYPNPSDEHEEILGEMLEHGGDALRSLAAYRAAELGLVRLRGRVAELGSSGSPLVRLVGQRSLAMFEQGGTMGVSGV